MENSIYWLIVLAIFIMIEILTLGLTTIWFAAGAFIAFIVSMFVDNILFELLIFLFVSMAFIFYIRPIVIKYFKPKRIRTNYDGVIGKEAVVTIQINNIKTIGQVTVNGQEWSAKSLTGNVIEKGKVVKVYGISDVKLVVNERQLR